MNAKFGPQSGSLPMINLMYSKYVHNVYIKIYMQKKTIYIYIYIYKVTQNNYPK